MEPGKTLGHYRLIDRLAAGGMGAVWAAEGGVDRAGIAEARAFLNR